MKIIGVSGLLLAIMAAATSCDAIASKDEVTLVVDNSALVPRAEPLLTGVGVHYGIGGGHNYRIAEGLAALNELGVDSYRDDIPWGEFDPAGDGKGRGQPALLFQFMKQAQQKPLLVLGYPNEKIPETDPPLKDEPRRKFAEFISEAMRATATAKPIYEIWNEWNMNAARRDEWLRGPGTETDPRAAINYARLAKAAVPAALQTSPDSTVLFGSVGEDRGWAWAQAMVADTGFGDDVPLSVHMYNQCKPRLERTATEMYDRLELLQKVLKPDGPLRPVFLTEFGWPTAPRHKCDVSREVAAENIGQFFLWAAAQPWLKGAWLYQLKDTGLDPADLERNFGLYDVNYRPKPAACAMREAVRLIKSSSAFALQRPEKDTFVLQLQSATGLRFVVWKTAMAGTADVILPQGVAATAKGLCSGPVEARDGALRVGGDPVIITVPDAGRVEMVVRKI